MNKIKKILLLYLMILMTSCSVNEEKIDKEADKSYNKNLQDSLKNEFDSINDFEELSDSELLVFGIVDNKNTMGKYDFSSEKLTKSKDIIKFSNLSSNIGFIENGFYITNNDQIDIYDNDLNFIKKIDAPNIGKSPLSLTNPLCMNEKGNQIYYTIVNEDHTSSVIEMSITDGKSKIICTYAQPDNLSVITKLYEIDDNTIGYLGQTSTEIGTQSIASFGTIRKNDGKINNTILDNIQFKTAKDSVIITDEENPNNINESKGYIFIYKDDQFNKLNVKGAKYIKPCSKDAFISHDLQLNPDTNQYTTYKTYLYVNGEIMKELNESNKYVYGDYITDFYMSKYNIFIQAVFSESTEESTYNVIDLSE